MHDLNKHKNGYDMAGLVAALPELKPYIKTVQNDHLTIDFSDSVAVKLLNKALLKKDYGVAFWDVPDGNLCPGVPGRADYLHHLADVVAPPTDRPMFVLDIGTGANLIYPILGSRLFNWHFVATDIDAKSIEFSQLIINSNAVLNNKIQMRLQDNPSNIFQGILDSEEFFDCSMCNPPFHQSRAEALAGNQRKTKNLAQNKLKRGSDLKQAKTKKTLNFAGLDNELWCPGGELAFITRMIDESCVVKHQVGLFTTLVSKKENVGLLIRHLQQVKAQRIEVVEMQQGSKINRILCWAF